MFGWRGPLGSWSHRLLSAAQAVSLELGLRLLGQGNHLFYLLFFLTRVFFFS